MDETTSWLLEGPAWVEYRTRRDLLHQSEDDEAVQAARRRMLADPAVQSLLAELADFPGKVLTSHKSAGHPLHKLSFAVELGLKADDPGMSGIIARILEHPSTEGPFTMLVNVPPQYGGTGQDEWCWMLCDAPLLQFILAKAGLGADERVQKAWEYLVSLVRENGFPCDGGHAFKKFRGPGKASDPCPYANLVMLKALAVLPERRESRPAHLAAETLLDLWANRREKRPYIFYMGTDFCKLKAPLVWYDLLHVLDVLSRLPWLQEDPRYLDMKSMLAAKVDADGRFTPESVWLAWKGWDFGQKRAPSPGLTLLAQRILRRRGEAEEEISQSG
jgi:hypothetical protein